MVSHVSLGDSAFARARKINELINSGVITLGGNRNDKIYGTLQCRSGKRMKAGNRVFFADESEALAEGYRPCGHCMPAKYKAWKAAKTKLNER